MQQQSSGAAVGQQGRRAVGQQWSSRAARQWGSRAVGQWGSGAAGQEGSRAAGQVGVVESFDKLLSWDRPDPYLSLGFISLIPHSALHLGPSSHPHWLSWERCLPTPIQCTSGFGPSDPKSGLSCCPSIEMNPGSQRLQILLAFTLPVYNLTQPNPEPEWQWR